MPTENEALSSSNHSIRFLSDQEEEVYTCLNPERNEVASLARWGKRHLLYASNRPIL